ncbi:MAG: lytic transglycosylase domain-containing protein [Deltaproteobacteria bacterium]|nr:lytic transglycosylase domain-containing protein [Deltaproteobacteria bacterium]
MHATPLLLLLILGPAAPAGPQSLAEILDRPGIWARSGHGELDAALRAARWDEVARRAAALRPGATPEDAPRLAFLEARARLELGSPEELARAAALFEGPAMELAGVEPWALRGLARCRQGLGDDAGAAAALAGMTAGSALAEEAGRALCRSGAPGTGRGTVAACTAWLERFGDDAEIRLALARGLLAEGRVADAHAALVRTEVLHPVRSAAGEARRLRQELEAKHPGLRRDLTTDERLQRAQRFLEAYRYDDALDELRFLRDRAGLEEGSPAWCDALALGGRTRSRQREETLSLEWFGAHLASCPLPAGDAGAELLFVAGRAAFAASRSDLAGSWLADLVRRHPGSRYEDDALLLLARLALRDGDENRARGHLERLVEGAGNRDMAADGAWLLARLLWDRGEYRELVAWVDRAAPAFRGETDYRSQGRLPYWRARALQRLDRGDEAAAGFREVACGYPLSWYGLLALERLHARRDGDGARTLEACSRDGVLQAGITAEEIPASVILADPVLAAGVILADLGLADWALEAWRAGPEDPPDHRLLMARAALLHRAGEHVISHDIVRRRLPHLLLRPPVGPARRWWEIAYPLPFRTLVEEQARAQGLDPWLVFGIIREESGFNPAAESYAHALGLMQLLEKTARWVARGTDLRVSRHRLRSPGTNIALGTRFLRYLLNELVHPALAVAGYNCGKGGIRRVQARERSRRLDEFVERIPFDQTCRYTKRVLSSAAIYRHLYGGGWRPGTLDLRLPRPPRRK